MPVVHFQNESNWYAEARYNYEDAKTFSLYAGKTFSKNAKLTYDVTPMLGGSIGYFKSISAGLSIELSYQKYFFSCQSQYSYSIDNFAESFFYNWSELGVNVSPWFYTGFSVQQTRLYQTKLKLEPGIMAGFSFKNCTVPLYCFSLLSENRYFIIGLNFRWRRLSDRYQHLTEVN